MSIPIRRACPSRGDRSILSYIQSLSRIILPTDPILPAGPILSYLWGLAHPILLWPDPFYPTRGARSTHVSVPSCPWRLVPPMKIRPGLARLYGSSCPTLRAHPVLPTGPVQSRPARVAIICIAYLLKFFLCLL